jgi:hypothetical protein
MGFAKQKRKLREAISKWDCNGYFGYGQGRGVAELGERPLRKKSVCLDVCTKVEQCRLRHHMRMDGRYPQLEQITANAVRQAKLHRRDHVTEIVEAMERAVELDIDEAVEVKAILAQFRIESMTDHYRAGQFENIQNGLDKKDATHRRPIPASVKKAS